MISVAIFILSMGDHLYILEVRCRDLFSACLKAVNWIGIFNVSNIFKDDRMHLL